MIDFLQHSNSYLSFAVVILILNYNMCCGKK